MANANVMNNLLPFPATAIRPTGNRKIATSSSSSGSSWWSPLFGWSPEPDYIDSEKPARTRFAPGCFTPEKAKQLRMMTKDTASFHDVMYHSAIASRLALHSDNVNHP